VKLYSALSLKRSDMARV